MDEASDTLSADEIRATLDRLEAERDATERCIAERMAGGRSVELERAHHGVLSNGIAHGRTLLAGRPRDTRAVAATTRPPLHATCSCGCWSRKPSTWPTGAATCNGGSHRPWTGPGRGARPRRQCCFAISSTCSGP